MYVEGCEWWFIHIEVKFILRYNYFYKTLETLKRNYNIPYSIDIIEFDSDEGTIYGSFSKSVAKVITDNNNSYEEVFNIINGLIDEYNIPRVQASKTNKYGGEPLKKHLKK